MAVPLVIRTIRTTTGLVTSELFVYLSEGSATGKTIFDLIAKEFTESKIPWETESEL